MAARFVNLLWVTKHAGIAARFVTLVTRCARVTKRAVLIRHLEHTGNKIVFVREGPSLLDLSKEEEGKYGLPLCFKQQLNEQEVQI